MCLPVNYSALAELDESAANSSDESLAGSFGRNIISCTERLRIQKVAMFAGATLIKLHAPVCL